jgi:hypothetical protein
MIWLPDGDDLPDREKHTIRRPKLMLTFAWNPNGFQIGNAILCNAKGAIFMAAYYIHNIVTEIAVRHGERRERRLVMHADKVRSPAAKVTGAFYNDNILRIPPHPPSPSDLTPSDVFLFLVWPFQNCL